jgi:hypothetical protein
MRVPGLLTVLDAGVSKLSLVTAANLTETGDGFAKCGRDGIAARASVGSGAGLACCATPLSELPVGRSSPVAVDAVRLGRAEGPILPGYGRTLAEAAVLEAAGRAERLVPAIMRVPALLTGLDAGVSKLSLVTAANLSETGDVCGKRGWYGIAARASTGSDAGLVLCAAPLSALPVGRSSPGAVDAVRLGRAGATASAVGASARVECPLVPAVRLAPELLTESDAGVSKPSLVTAENFAENPTPLSAGAADSPGF